MTSILKYGTNLLQAIGQFNGKLEHKSFLSTVWYSSSSNRNSHHCLGHYVIVVAFMSVISSSETPVLHDYVKPAVAAVDSGMPKM